MTAYNIVWLFLDDASQDAIEKAMPNLAALGPVVFPRSFLPTPLCSPARGSAFTGQSREHHGLLDNSYAETFSLIDRLPSRLKAAGYTNGHYGKILNGFPFALSKTTIPPGWDDFVNFDDSDGAPGQDYFDYDLIENGTIVSYGSDDTDYCADVLSGHATTFVETAAEPFFCYVPHFAPHNIAGGPVGPTRHAGLYTTDTVRDANHNLANLSGLGHPAWLIAEYGSPRDAGTINDLDEARREGWRATRSIDDGLQDLVDAIDARGALDRTVFIVSNDNGTSFGEHRMGSLTTSARKAHPYQHALAAQINIVMPGVTGRTDQSLVTHWDLMPTICELAGVVPADVVDGMSLVPLLSDTPPADWRDDVYLSCDGAPWGVPAWDGIVALYNGDYWKFVVHDGDNELLFDLGNDPYEVTNVVGSNTAVRNALLARLIVLRRELT